MILRVHQHLGAQSGPETQRCVTPVAPQQLSVRRLESEFRFYLCAGRGGVCLLNVSVVVLLLLAVQRPGWCQTHQTAQGPEAPPVTSATPPSGAMTWSDAKRVVGRVQVNDPMLTPPSSQQETLNSLRHGVRIALQDAPSLGIARQRRLEAAAEARAILGNSLLSVDASAQVARNQYSESLLPQKNDPTVTVISGSLEARQPLLNLQTWTDYAAAKADGEAREWLYKDEARQLFFALTDALASVLTAEQAARIRRKSLENGLRAAALARLRRKLQLGTELDVLRAEQEISDLRLFVIDADETLRRAKEALGRAMGREGPWGAGASLTLDNLVERARSFCADTERPREDVQAAQYEVAASRLQKRALAFRFVPTLEAIGTINVVEGLGASVPNILPRWSVGAALAVPLFNGGSRYATYLAAQRRFESAKLELVRTTLDAQLERSQASRAVGVARARLAVSQRTQSLAKRTTELSEVSFLMGKSSSFELLETIRRHRDTTLDTLLKRSDLLRAELRDLTSTSGCTLGL